jgi:hypothetical protein
MATIQPFEFPKPQPVEVNKSDEGQMPTENLSDLLGRVSKTSFGELDNLIGDFEGLEKATDRPRSHSTRD